MKLRTFSIEDLIVAGNACEREFTERLGYNDARFFSVDVTDYDIKLHFELTDDFQSGLSHDERWDAGWGVTIDCTSDDPVAEVYTALQRWSTRPQRELQVMARQLAKIGQTSEDMVTKQVEAFVDQIKQAQSDIAKLEYHES
tara:strand:- start:6743 stop:7168 length:426 start_codon:yes stop_codon:yes gene_type:complete